MRGAGVLHPDLGPGEQSHEGGPSEGDQGANAEREAVVEQGGVPAGQGPDGVLRGLLRMLLQVEQLEAAAEQQVQELRLQGEAGERSDHRHDRIEQTLFVSEQ